MEVKTDLNNSTQNTVSNDEPLVDETLNPSLKKKSNPKKTVTSAIDEKDFSFNRLFGDDEEEVVQGEELKISDTANIANVDL